MVREKLAYQLALLRTPGIGPVTFEQITQTYGDLAALFEKPHQAHTLSNNIQAALASPDWSTVEADLAWADPAQQRYILDRAHPSYPILLNEIADPPQLLFVQGDLTLLNHHGLAMVGSRNPTASGRDNAYEFARYLVQSGLVITSGLAMGIDAAAHTGALAGEGQTIAVVGTGLDRVYPAKHRALAHQIAASGLLVSEFPLGTPPRSENFPRRNRIISGLSLGTLVVEAALKSGSLITARMAMEQGREVFAIPGSIHNSLARGCHQLIRQGAKLVESAEDIFEELQAIAGVLSAINTPSVILNESIDEQSNDPDYQKLFEFLGFDPIPVDELIARCGLTAEVVSSMLLVLELKGQVISLPGGRYQRCRA